MSTESGIPDFRSAGGIWTEDASRMEAMSLDYFLSYPRLFYQIQRIVPDENERQL